MATLALRSNKVVMYKAGWKLSENDEACYIDIENDDKDTDDESGSLTVDSKNKTYSNWNNLPDLVLEQIFTYLTPRERYYAGLVCKQWFKAFYLPTVWDNFLVNDRTLTRQKYNYYSGWQYCLDHMRTQNCLARIGRYLRGLEFRPESSFNNIYQFMTMLSWSIEKGAEANSPKEIRGTGVRIRSLIYIFPCNMSQANDPIGIKLFGTGGQLLKGLKDLLSKLTNLRVLKLIDFVLEHYEAKHLLDEVLDACCTKMRVLNLVNVTTSHCPIIHVGLFLNLQVLTISPQNIDDDVLLLLADTKLKHLHLLQNCYTSSYLLIDHCSVKAWRILKRDNPKLKVHLRVESLNDGEIVFQPEAPVYSITYAAPKTRIHPDILMKMVDSYKNHLAIYGYEMLPRFISAKSFHNRIDSLMLLICRQCFNLHTLLVREKVSTSTILLIAHTAKNLRRFYVRRFGTIIRCDWPRNPEWSDEFYMWLRHSCRSYQSVEREVSQILGYNWHFLSDQEYKQVIVDVQAEWKLLMIKLNPNQMRGEVYQLINSNSGGNISLKSVKDNSKVESYRPISLLPTLSRSYEKLSISKLNPIPNENGSISNNQFGFKRKHSTMKSFRERRYCLNNHIHTPAFTNDIAFLNSYEIGEIVKVMENKEDGGKDIGDKKGSHTVDNENNTYSDWNNLPDLVLGQIFTYLTPKECYYAGLVCKQWFRVFCLPTVWENLFVDDSTLTKRKYIYYSGWQYSLDHKRAQHYLVHIGRYLKSLEFRPESSFKSIYQFMIMLSRNIEKGAEANSPKEIRGTGARIRSLIYVYPNSKSKVNMLFSTGSQLLKGLKDFLSKLTNLRVLKLINFVLNRYEAKHLLDEVLDACCTKMRVLNLVNITTSQCSIMHVGLFLNLQVLTISPQNIDDDVLLLLADTKLEHLHLLQNCCTSSYQLIDHCSVKAWRILKRDNYNLKVHLRVESSKDGEIVLQPEAPIYSITYAAPQTRIHPDILMKIVDNYKNHLTIYGYEMLARFGSAKSFHNRIDSLMLLICRQCFNLHTLLLREKMSTSTILLIAHTAKNLRRFYVRRFGTIIRCDWPRNPEWSDEFYMWLRNSCRSYHSVEREVSQILGYNWHFLSDQKYKRIKLNVQVEW